MEGHWAQLTVDAHIAHAIDYRRPVKEFIEDVIHMRLLFERRMKSLGMYPAVDDDGHQVMASATALEELTDKWLFPWNKRSKKNTKVITNPDEQLRNRIKKLQDVQRRLSNQ